MSSAQAPLLDVHGVESGYGRVQVLRGLSLSVGAGEGVGLFGPNGHGKTTLLRMLSGLLPVWKGQVSFAGEVTTRATPRRIVGLGLVHVAQGNTLFPELTVGEVLDLGAAGPRARSGRRDNLERVFTLFPRLAERRHQRCRTLSGGERQMVSIGVGLMCVPRMLILDEPTLGLAPKLKDELCGAIAQIRASGVPLLVVEQDVEFLLTLTDRLYLIDHGAVVREIDARQGLNHADVMEVYFGGHSP